MPISELSFFRSIISPFNLSFLDIFLVILWIIFLRQERLVGGIRSALTLLKFFIAFLLSMALYPFLSRIGMRLGLYKGTADAVSILILTGSVLFLLQQISNQLIIADESPDSVTRFFPYFTGSFTFFLVTAWFISIVLAFPISSSIKDPISNSLIATYVQSSIDLLDIHIQQMLGNPKPLSINSDQVTSLSSSVYNLNFQTNLIRKDNTAAIQLLDQINQLRNNKNLSMLEQNADLSSVALEQAKNIARTGVLATTSSLGYSIYDRLSMMNIPYSSASEIAIHASSFVAAMTSLQNISGSQQIMLNPTYSVVGLSSVEAGPFGEIFVLDFLQP